MELQAEVQGGTLQLGKKITHS